MKLSLQQQSRSHFIRATEQECFARLSNSFLAGRLLLLLSLSHRVRRLRECICWSRSAAAPRDNPLTDFTLPPRAFALCRSCSQERSVCVWVREGEVIDLFMMMHRRDSSMRFNGIALLWRKNCSRALGNDEYFMKLGNISANKYSELSVTSE